MIVEVVTTVKAGMSIFQGWHAPRTLELRPGLRM
jgi:hypothetical protein